MISSCSLLSVGDDYQSKQLVKEVYLLVLRAFFVQKWQIHVIRSDCWVYVDIRQQ